VDDITRVTAAYRALTKLLDDAQECRALFEDARVAVPEVLARLLSAGAGSNGSRKSTIPKPPSPSRPSGAAASWIWVPLKEASVVTVVRCVLQGAGQPLSRKEVRRQVARYKSDAADGSIDNIGTRLNGTHILREDGTWRAANPSEPPILHEDHAWGPIDAFEMTDVAYHRREALVHVLKVQPDGLQPMQLVRTLEQCEWLHTPINKDLIKLDLEVLTGAGRVKKGGGTTGKYRAAEESTREGGG
jgi:hypothetical protein